MKDQLKTIIDAYFDEWECPSNKIHSKDLAECLDKAIGIDEEKINSELLARGEWFYKFQEGNASCGWLRHKISKAIKELQPLKVTVENE